MENKYDNEFVRKQLHEIYGKGHSYDEFKDELDKLVMELHKESINADAFRKQYQEDHKLCPRCGSEKYFTTLAGYPLNMKEKDSYKDLNTCTCTNCGDVHTTHNRVGEIRSSLFP